MVDTEHKSK